MSLRSWLSRSSFWLAALAALASLWLPEPLGSRLATVALAAAALSLIVWRGWRPPARDLLASESSMLDDADLLEATAQIARCCACAPDLNDALRGVGRVLAHELGARNVLAARVVFEQGMPSVKPLLDLTLPRQRAAGALLREAGARALRERGIVSDAELGHAVTVLDGAMPLALIEFDGLELGIAPAAQERLLELVRAELNDVAQRARSSVSGTARLQALRAQADEPDFLLAVSANRQVSLFVLDPHELRIDALSRRAERDFSVRARSVLGKTVGAAFGAGIAEAAERATRQAIESGKTVEQEIHWSTRRGQRGANVSVCALRHPDGTPRLLIAMARHLGADPLSGGERRTMPRHGLLHDDARPAPLLAPLPTAAPTVRRDGVR